MREFVDNNTSRNENPITEWLRLIGNGDEAAHELLFQYIVTDLRKCAGKLMSQERVDHTLGISGLINEACLKLISQQAARLSDNRRQLFAAAHRAMRQILVDHERVRSANKRGGNLTRSSLDVVIDKFTADNGFTFEQLYEALEILERESLRQREIVEHRFFSGLTIEETATLLSVSSATVERDWKLARIKLYSILNGN